MTENLFYSLVIECQDPDPLLDGLFSPSVGPYYYGDTVTYSCNYGFSLRQTQGGPEHRCGPFSNWIGSLQLCEGKMWF